MLRPQRSAHLLNIRHKAHVAICDMHTLSMHALCPSPTAPAHSKHTITLMHIYDMHPLRAHTTLSSQPTPCMHMHDMHMACSLCGTCTQGIDAENAYDTKRGTHALQDSVILKLFPSVCPPCWDPMTTGWVCLVHYTRAWAHSLLCAPGHTSTSTVHRLSPFQSCTTKPLGTPLLPFSHMGQTCRSFPGSDVTHISQQQGPASAWLAHFPLEPPSLSPWPALTTPLTKQRSGGRG